MRTLSLALDVPPAELLRRLPRRAGTFLLDGGGPDSWGSGEALLGWEPSRVLAVSAAATDRCAPFAALDTLLRSPDVAAVCCALAYDLGRGLEIAAPPPPTAGVETPALFAAAHPWVLAYSYATRGYELRSPVLAAPALREVARRVERCAREPATGTRARGAVALADQPRERYFDAVKRILEYIAAGDVYQVNLSQRFTTGAVEEPPANLFARMSACHPAPYGAYVDGGAWALVSGSPECFLRRQGERVSTYPIKGTRRRGATAAEEDAMARELRSSVKDRAEHLMIVDLERNDLGRVCRVASIHVPRLASLRTFSTLHHLESEVSGELLPGTTTAELLHATFPGGSITGAPKIRAMQIIDELEPVARGFYTGAIGLATADGTACFNIAIRTAVATSSGLAYYAGGGIVADSEPEAEYEETLLKARAFFEALEPERR